MPANAFWNITFGTYAFTVDRRDLTYRLEEATTRMLWSDALSLGSVEIIARETGVATRYAFGEMKIISLSEKSGATGKRILFGLDAPGGIPVDVYLTCTEREIQLTVEASRDTKTHRVGEIVLLPGLCTVADDGASHLVIPQREGAILFAKDVPEATTALRVWDADSGLTMPFVGAVRFGGPPAPNTGGAGGLAGVAVSLPKASLVRAPSDAPAGTPAPPVLGAGGPPKRTALALLTDSAYAVADLSRDNNSARLDLRYERDPERRRLDVRIVLMPGGDHVSVARAYRDKIIGDGGHTTLRKKMREKPALSAWLDGDAAVPAVVRQVTLPQDDNRWLAMEDWLPDAQDGNTKDTVYAAELCGDWAVPFVDVWIGTPPPRFGVAVPLVSVVHHDATPLCFTLQADDPKQFLRALLRVAPPVPSQTPTKYAGVLHKLHRLSVGAFLTGHRFLTPDFAVEEARYSNEAHIVINQSETDDYESGELRLPPLGFSVTHPQMTESGELRSSGGSLRLGNPAD